MAATLIHATCIASAERAVLIRGPSGAGKSDLALRCLAMTPSVICPFDVMLVADDQVLVEADNGQLFASCPLPIVGQIEVRGVGIVSLEAASKTRVVLVADLLGLGGRPERLPDQTCSTEINGCHLEAIVLNPFEASAPVKLLMALSRAKAPTRS